MYITANLGRKQSFSLCFLNNPEWSANTSQELAVLIYAMCWLMIG